MAGLYGSGLDGDAYLRRCIDLSWRLPEPPVHDFVTWLAQRWGFPDEFRRLQAEGGLAELIDCAAALSADLGLRDIEQRFTVLNVVLRSVACPPYPVSAIFWTTMVFLEGRDPDLFRAYAEGRIGAESLFETLKRWRAWWDAVATDPRIRASLIAFSHDQSELEQEVRKVSQQLTQGLPSPLPERLLAAREVLEEGMSLRRNPRIGDVRTMIAAAITQSRRFG